MSTKREFTHSVPSVMARLMGLDEMPIQRPVQKKPRVLSENYLHTVSSIGVRKKCSVQQSFKFSIEQQDEYINVFQVLETLRTKKHHTMAVVNTEMPLSSSDVLQSGCLAMLKSSCTLDFRDISKCSTFRRKSEIKYLNSPKKIWNGVGVYSSDECCIDHTSEYWRSIPNSRIVIINPNLGKKNEVLIPPNRKLCVEKKERKRLPNGKESIRPRFRKEKTKVVGQSTGTMSTVEPRSGLRSSNYFGKETELRMPSSTFSDRKRQTNCSGMSYMTREAKKQVSERGKPTKRFKHVADKSESRSRTLLAHFNSVENPNPNMRWESLKSVGCMSDFESSNLMWNEFGEPGFNHIDGLECRRSHSNYKKTEASCYLMPEQNFSVGNYMVQDDQRNKLKKGSAGQISAVSQYSQQKNKTLLEACLKLKGNKNGVEEGNLIDAKTQAMKKSPPDYEKHQLESNNCMISEKEDSFLHIRDALQEMSNETFCEEESVSSQCSYTDPESLISFEEAYQPSPNSVLDRLGKKHTSSDCFKSMNASLHGLHLQLELLKSMTSEAYSEGSSMVVSSDDDNGEGSVNESEKNQGLLSPFRVDESRDFSYLVDVLTEAGLQSRKHDNVYPFSYSLFERLEKKYGEQISWKRAERRLLFDRINSGLAVILQPLKGTLTWTKSVAKRLRFSHEDDVVEELWVLLVSQEEEENKESEKILGKDDRWMELGDEIQVIGREIEDSLIDELIADVSVDNF